ncbi:uncharacterized protein LOC126992160 [Eriocheir sinensis]|uniref:uncharacterized protein LOC126992160 n=1 Tax=Eriocheir sinensis TaxID=95602 RepID=UPI0021CA6937|nr:uncharacterized protein LOC126992160 [Eriocheir sinensis]
MDTLLALRGDVEKLKESSGATGGGADVAATLDSVNTPVEVPCSGSAAGFSGFKSPDHRVSSDDDDSQDDIVPGSVLLQCAKTYGPVDDVSVDIDKQVADMVNHVFDNGLRDEEYKEILDDDSARRPGNCHALAPVDCNSQVLDALKADAKKGDFRMKEVSKDIIKAATILTKSLTVLDRIAQDGRPDVAHEVGMLNGALALLGHANHRNNLTRRFVIKREINQRYSHLCSDKVPMTRFVFGDDVSQSAKNIEDSEKLKTKIIMKKPLPTWKFGAGKVRGSFGKFPYKGLASRFHPYGQRTYGHRSDHRQPYSRQGSEAKNSRGRGRSNPRQ